MTNPAQAGGAPDVPAGFEIVEGKRPLPIVRHADLDVGALVKYEGVGKSAGGSVRHYFINDGGCGARFAVWGTADLNVKLGKLPQNTVVFLRYDGQQADTDEPQKDRHVWTVMRARTPEQIAAGRETWRRQIQKLSELLNVLYLREWGEPPATAAGEPQ